MSMALRQCSAMARALAARPLTPTPMSPSQLLMGSTRLASAKAAAQPKASGGKKPVVDCACSRHPVPEEKTVVIKKERAKDCNFDFRKLEVNPFDDPCDCKDPPPSAGCKDVGKAKEMCCRSTRQYGCFCEEEEESCEEEEEEIEVVKTCDLDFRKLEVNPYDDPCDCKDPPPASSCEALANREDVCCRTPRPFGCMCEAYDGPGLDCLKQKAPKQKREKKDCGGKKWGGKCL